MDKKIKDAVSFIKKFADLEPEVLIILGSGFGLFVEGIKNKIVIPYRDIPHFKFTTARSHAGNLVLGMLGEMQVVVMQGRFHVYEGIKPAETTFPVRVAKELGATILITTNLSGGIRSDMPVGSLMVVEDHMNFSGVNPLIWGEDRHTRKFVDMHNAYSLQLMDTIFTVARDVGISLRKGVLAYLTGPNFETRAELKVLKMFGADAVGWSMVPEVLEARRMGMEVLGIVCISDMSDPDALNAVDLDELYRLGEERTESLLKLLVALLERI